MPENLQAINAFGGSHRSLDQDIVQYPDLPTILELRTVGALKNVSNRPKAKLIERAVQFCTTDLIVKRGSVIPAAGRIFFLQKEGTTNTYQKTLEDIIASDAVKVCRHSRHDFFELYDGSYFCLPGRNIILHADSQKIMRTMLQKFDWSSLPQLPGTNAALHQPFNDLTHVNKTHSYWGVRSYDDSLPKIRGAGGGIIPSDVTSAMYTASADGQCVTLTFKTKTELTARKLMEILPDLKYYKVRLLSGARTSPYITAIDLTDNDGGQTNANTLCKLGLLH